ncbi:autotransporter adhesin [Luteibacter rhizovicinus]|uniref:Autotransporter adhesin n=1 Tax=Luteibacter rhizovicinus TaxID=242606 RepID=A0A4R3Z1P9_9GAMM|nr:YadA-like family protein [Luteibacter rhizovicinus]TCV97784.1 autotransporter adhesin [Luteibacter rhizovicinus]
MNKIHSKVWSRALNQLVVTSEIATRHGGGRQGQGGRRLSLRSLSPAIFTVLLASGWIGWASSAQAQSVDCTAGPPYNAYNSTASCMGYGAKASGIGATALGANANAQLLGGVAVGYASFATGQNNVAVGFQAYTTGTNSVYLGARSAAGTGATADNAIAIGTDVTSSAANAISMGSSSHASSVSAVAIGTNADASGGTAGGLAVAMGAGAKAVATNGGSPIAIGANSNASGSSGIVLPDGNTTTTFEALALGNKANATGMQSVAIGNLTSATGTWSTAVGSIAKASGEESTAIGQLAQATGTYATALGVGGSVVATAVTASGAGSLALGGNATSGAVASGVNAIAIGGQSVASSTASVAMGKSSKALAASTIAIGDSNTVAAAAGTGSMAGGHNSQVLGGLGAIALGEGQTANGNGAVAIGDPNSATGNGAIAMGSNNVSNGDGAVALGNLNNAQGQGSVAIGNSTRALAAGSLAFGDTATANNAGDVALGSGSTTAVAVGTANTVINGTTYNFVGTTPTSTVSVGAGGAERTVTNVAAGRISGASTDAINGSQLFATNQAVGTVGTTVTNLGNTIATSIGGGTTYNPSTGNLTTNVTYGGNTYNSLQQVFNQINGAVTGGGIKYFHANSTLADSNATGTDSVAIGPVSTASTTNAVSIGNGATAGTNVGDVALGAGSATGAVVATASGTINGNNYAYAGTTPTSTVSVGSTGAERTVTNVAAGQVNGASTDAINGSQLFATNQALETLNNNVVAGATHYYSVNDGGTAGGNYANNGATGLNALAAGVGASAAADNATALGQGTGVSVLGGVALGSGAVSDRAIAPSSGSILVGTNVIPYNTTDRTLLGAVSVGNATDFRQITNVADGTLDQDAVTLRQLKGAMSSFSVTPTKYFHANSTATDSLAAGAESVAIGPKTTVNGDNGIGMGNGAIVQQTAPGGTAIGQNATVNLADGVALGTNAVSNGIQAMALGAGTEAAFAGSVALGAGSKTDAAVGTAGATLNGVTFNFAGTTPGSTVSVGNVGAERTLTNVAAGRISGISTDAINGSQLYATNQTLAALYSQFNNLTTTVNNLPKGGTTTVNNTFQTSTDNTTQASSSGSNSTAAGAGSTASGNNSTAVGAGSTASGNNSVAIGAGSVASQTNSVSVGSVGNERTITNVAPGVNTTDAANVGQLNEAIQSAENWSKNYVDQRFQSVDRDLNRIGNRANAGIASAMAMASLPQAYQPNQNAAAVALGNFHGETGIAVGMSTITESGRYVLKLNATTNSRGDAGAGVGAAVVW